MQEEPDFNISKIFTPSLQTIILTSDTECQVLIDGQKLCNLKKNVPNKIDVSNDNHVLSFIHGYPNIIINQELPSCTDTTSNKIINVQFQPRLKKIEDDKRKIKEAKRAEVARRKKKLKRFWDDYHDYICAAIFLLCCLLVLLSIIIIVIGWYNGTGHCEFWNFSFWGGIALGTVVLFVVTYSE